MYFYKLYGLNIQSDKEITELVKGYNIENPDIIINFKKIDDGKKAYLNKNRWFYYNRDFTVFRIDKNATYLIQNEKEIIIEEDENCNKQVVKTFILGTSFGILLKQRNIVAIHGGAILIGDRTVIFTGHSGAGKSTITNAFRIRGFKFLADDVSATDVLEDGTVVVNPAYPQQKVCRDAMEKLGYSVDEFNLIDEGRGKYVIPATESFVYESMRLGAVCEIVIGDCEAVMIEEIKGIEKLNIIVKNIYRGEVFLRESIDSEYFKKIINIVKNISVYRITRPRDKFSVDEQIEAILNKLDYENEVLI